MFQPWHSQNIGVLSDQKLTGSLVNCRDCLPMSLGWGRTVFFIFEKKENSIEKSPATFSQELIAALKLTTVGCSLASDMVSNNPKACCH